MAQLESIGKKVKRIPGKNGSPDRFYHIGTSNKSFLQVARDLQQLGIKNYYFMLEIHDYSLVDVDPYSPNLTREQVSRIMNECTRNIWYYLREICRIPTQGGVGVPFKANRGNIAQTWCVMHGIDSWLTLPRQQGKTQSILAVFAWAYSFGTSSSNFIFVNKDGNNAKENLQRLKDQIDLLPEYLRFEEILEEDDNTGKLKIVKAIKNATSMKHPITKNRIIIKSKATNYESALSLARGLTAPVIHYDEPEFTNHIKTIVENSVSTYETAARNAKANGAMYARCFSCTPGDLDTNAGMEAQLLLSGTTKWTEKMYDMAYDPYDESKNEVLKYVRDNGQNGIVYIEYSYKQIGLTDEWLHRMYNSIQNPLVVKREILLQRLRGSSDSPFDQEDIEYITESGKVPIGELFILDHFRFDIYKELDRTIPYLVGVDCSTGTNGDNNAITIINPYTEEPDAEFQCPYIGETMFEKLLQELIKKHIPRGVLIIERNSVGDGIIDHLLNSPISQNLYFDKAKDLVEENMANISTVTSMLKKKGEIKKYYGVYTGTESRKDMFAILFNRVAEYKEKFITKNIITDLAHLVQNSAGKIAAAPGEHDDSIMSYLIAMYVFYHGNNLHTFGITKGARYDVEQNKGLPQYTDSELYDLLPRDIVDTARRQEQVRRENDYSRMMEEAILQSQRESLALHRKGLVHNDVLDNTADYLLDDIYENDGEIAMDFFDSLNGY